ncbi:MAG TPA: LON peptidase substrate-binding domain-containing protein, partial [Tepidisphaeraceae bacterium]|nr:LON peptidase substrate-binding domain-containing protein [Tepidisphaeraceae bacterium]
MAEFEIIEKTDATTTLKAVGSGQQLKVPSQLPILPLKNIVLFPGAVMQLDVPKALLEEVMLGEKVFGVIAQKNNEAQSPTMDDLYSVGVVCVVLKLFRMRDSTQAVIVHGLTRFRLLSIAQSEPYLSAKVEVLAETSPTGTEIEALVNSVRQQAARMIELTPDAPEEAGQVLSNITSPSLLADFLASNLPKGQVSERQRLLEEFDIEKRLRSLAAIMASQLDVMELQSRINDQVKENIDKSQRRYYLQEQMKAIRKELGGAEGGGGGGSEVD